MVAFFSFLANVLACGCDVASSVCVSLDLKSEGMSNSSSGQTNLIPSLHVVLAKPGG